jgi:hypothetical protein
VIISTSTLEDVAFEVCTTLAKRGLKVVLVGGSAATFYAPAAYQSYDADFIALFAADRTSQTEVTDGMQSLGYSIKDNLFVHSSNPFTVEFPKGPLAIGGTAVTMFDTIKRGGQVLNILTPTDCVRDRLAKYYFWDDFSGLSAAIAVTGTHRAHVNVEQIREWSKAEGEGEKFEHFLSQL